MKYTSKVNYANKNNTLKVVIPSEIAEHLEISAKDTIKWIINEDNTVTIEKLIL